MTSPKHADDSNPRGRTYPINGEHHESVTSVCGVINKPALPPWSARLAAQRAVESEHIWHAIQDNEGDDAAKKWIAAAAREYTKQKATMGSLVHALCEGDMDEGKLEWFLDKMDGARDKNLDTAMKHLDTFNRWKEENQVTFHEQEVTVFHDTFRYAGTTDGIISFGDDPSMYVFDIKTGGVYQEAALQMSAYGAATHILDDDGIRPFEYPCVAGVILQLKPKSYDMHIFDIGYETWEVFLAALKIKRWKDGD